ncbi:hypothetical protein JL721_7341 [Aureococcus anophagefferens]|nr:hypothetical protein JL721_7341 [Aureococcus anophagefferens]
MLQRGEDLCPRVARGRAPVRRGAAVAREPAARAVAGPRGPARGAVAAGAPSPRGAPALGPWRAGRGPPRAAAPPANAAAPAAAAAARTPGRAPAGARHRRSPRGPAPRAATLPLGPGPTRGDVVPWGQTPAGDWVALPSAPPRGTARRGAAPPALALAPPPALLAPPPVLVLAPATALRLRPGRRRSRESAAAVAASDDGSAAGAARGAKRPRSAEGGGSAEPKAKRTRERWTAREHELFLDGLERFGKKWKLIKELIPTKTVTQVRTHANGHFSKMLRRTVGKPDALEVSHALLALRSIAG